MPTQGTIPDVPGNTTKDQTSILSESVSAFHSKMLEKISQLENENFLYSPLSLHMGLFQTYLGAPKNSSTRKELAGLLEINPEEDAGYLENYQSALNTLNAQGS